MGKNDVAILGNGKSANTKAFFPNLSLNQITISPNIVINISKQGAQEDKKEESKSGIGKFMDSFQKVSDFMAPIGKIASAGMKMTDNYINASSRLGIVNDGLQTTGQLQDKIFASAERSKGSYSAMSNAMIQLGMNAKDSFTNNDEMLAFTETVQKAFTVTGKSAEDQVTGFSTLAQIMSLGKIQGKDFEQLIQKAPEVANAVAKYMGKTTGELKNLDAKNAVSADVLKNAMFAAGDGINEKFDKVKDTFDDITDKSNMVQKAFERVFQKISEIINSPGIKVLEEGFAKGLLYAAYALEGLINGFVWLGAVIQQNWGAIAPILAAIGGALAFWTITMIPTLMSKISWLVAELWLMVEPILVQAGAWIAANWPILAIGAAIGFLLYAMINFGDTTVTVFGIICGSISLVLASLYNFIATLWNSMSDLGTGISNIFIKIFNFVGEKLDWVAKRLNDLLGLNLKTGFDLSEIDNSGVKMQTKDLSEAFNYGQNLGKSIGGTAIKGVQGAYEKVKDFGGKLASPNMSNVDNIMKGGAAPYVPAIDSINQPVQVVGKNSDNLNVDMSQEDLKYLKDIAEREYINNFSTATLAPNVSITFGDVNKEADVDQVAARIQRILQEQIAVVAEGAY